MGALKKPHCPLPTTEKKSLTVVDKAAENAIYKAEIQRMKQLVSEKIKDPKLAQKAAMIISEMLNAKN